MIRHLQVTRPLAAACVRPTGPDPAADRAVEVGGLVAAPGRPPRVLARRGPAAAARRLLGWDALVGDAGVRAEFALLALDALAGRHARPADPAALRRWPAGPG